MKTIRRIAGVLLLITCVLHFIMYAKMQDEPGAIGLIVFGIIYGTIGVLLFTRKMYPVYLGLVIPLIGLIIALIKFGVPELVSLETALHLIDVVVIACCAVLIAKHEKVA
jgi:prepilin signal peptidase PulO-like enzyme (type II secretory pathway)